MRRCGELVARIRDRLSARRRRHRKLQQYVDARIAEVGGRLAELDTRFNDVSDYLLALPDLAASVPLAITIPITINDAAEVCLFVSFASEPTLKPHVRNHVRSLVGQGISVVLIVNSPHSSQQFNLDPEFTGLLSGCLIRANLGFDFAAWAHAYSLLELKQCCKRLYLVNDSVVGPLSADAYVDMIAQIRASTADMLGLTENCRPRPHLQSYFLVVNERLLHSDTLRRLMQGIVNLPTKQGVIAQYETQLTRFLRAKDFRCEAVFPNISHDVLLTDDTIFNWARLIEIGFPFIKGRVLEEFRQSPEALRLVPEEYRRPSR